MSFGWTAFYTACVSFVIGAILFKIGRRGRSIDDHPLCPSCGFDWFGLPTESTCCPECGKPTRDPIIGNRVRNIPLYWCGLGMILVSTLVIATAIYARMFSNDLATYRPAALLRWDVNANDSYASASAQAELLRRLRTGELTQSQIDATTEQCLTKLEVAVAGLEIKYIPLGHHGRANMYEDDWLAECFSTQRMRVEHQERYARTLVRAEIFARQQVRQGDGWPMRLQPYLAGVDLQRISKTVDAAVVLHDGATVIIPTIDPHWRKPLSPLRHDVFLIVPANDQWLHSRSPGRISLTAEVTITTTIAPRSAPLETCSVTQVITTPLTLEILPSSVPSSIATTKHGTVSSAYFDRVRLTATPTLTPGTPMVRVQFKVRRVMPLSMRCLLVADDRKWDLGPILISADGLANASVESECRGFDTAQADIVLEPDPTAAARTVHMTEHVDQRVVFEKQRVEW